MILKLAVTTIIIYALWKSFFSKPKLLKDQQNPASQSHNRQSENDGIGEFIEYEEVD